MKKLLNLLLSAVMILAVGCSAEYDDSLIWDKLNSLENRVAALEQLCRQMNTNITSLQTVVEALQNNDYVTNIAPITEDGKVIGYTITFSKRGAVTIYHGKDGKDGTNGTNGKDGQDGYTPVIGVAKDTDGVYYWTLDGDWLLDNDGNKIKAEGVDGKDGQDGADGKDGQDGEDGQDGVNGTDGKNGEDGKDGKDGITPKLKIENGYWYISYDNGATWEELGKATGEDGKDGADGEDGTGGDSMFKGVTYDDDFVYITLTDGSKLVIPRVPYPTNNEIWYTSTDSQIVKPYKTNAFGANILSNVYENGKGVITFDGAVTSIGDYAFRNCSSLTSITIPDSVTSIGEYAFSGCNSLTSITIPDSVTSIGENAFDGCSSLTSVTIPDSVTSIGWYAFRNCSSLEKFYGKFASEDNRCLIVDGVLKSFAPAGLTTYDIPYSVTEIEDSAFYYCSSLTSITIPDSVTSIGWYAFSGCRRLTSITIPDSVTSIGPEAFRDCSSLTSITIPDSVTSIGWHAFRNCSSLTSVYCKATTPPTGGGEMFYNNASGRKIYVPTASVEAYKAAYGWRDYADYIFSDQAIIWYTATEKVKPNKTDVFGANIISNNWDSTTGIGEITFDGDVTQIGNEAFQRCSSLTSVTIPNSVTEIGNSAFRDCSSLTSITIPDSVTEIGWGAFTNCSRLTSITIPDSVTEIGFAAFFGCSSLEKFYGKFASEDNRCLIIDGVLNSFAPAGLTSYTIPDSVTEIGTGAFEDCSSLTSVTIPDSVTKIGDHAFTGCISLTSITIPNSVTSIGTYAFYNCSSLTSITIPDSVTSIGMYAFEGCSSLTSVTIPDGITSIGYSAFRGCSSLTSVYCQPTTPPTGDSYMFDLNASGRKIYVPTASVDAYKTAAGWADYADAIEGYYF